MGEKDFNEHGLSTQQALNKLEIDIEQLLTQYEHSQKLRKSRSWIRDAFHHSSRHSFLNHVSFAYVVLSIILLAASSSFNLECTSYHATQAIVLVILLPLNMLANIYDCKLRYTELPRRVRALLVTIRAQKQHVLWEPDNYPHLLLPFSPCITLQWTYRDNQLVNLPWALLVKDDVILMRPGQISPGFCECIDKNPEYPLLHAKEVYGPTLQNANECYGGPKLRTPLDNKRYKLLETPYLSNLRIALEQALDKPITVQDHQRHFMTVKVTQYILIPMLLVTTFITNGWKSFFSYLLLNDFHWTMLFMAQPVSVILPLLHVFFPVVWIALVYIGMARFTAIYNQTLLMNRKATKNSFEDLSNDLTDLKIICNYREIWNNFVDICKGKENTLVRSTNIVHVLGSLTALCCVDKKGILSWPNPTAEKVFILRNVDDVSATSSLANLGDLCMDAESLHGMTGSLNKNEGNVTTVAEVLDITHDAFDPFKMQFDDTNWNKHLTSLKPLGLAILLNTCNINTQEDYTKFCSHITCEAMYNENLIPVTNRRCLCELAKEIGFVDSARKIFTLEQQLSTFRHLQTEMARRDNKYVRSLQLATKLKFPFPHMFSVVVKESSGSTQLLSQGTADIILDSCIDYWDGHDLCTLTYSDRKKIQDFYQRSSLTAYCTAFAYRPLYKNVNEKLGRLYLELPSDSRHLYLNHRSPTPIHSDCRSVLEPLVQHLDSGPKRIYSADSLLYSDVPVSEVSDVDSFFEMQCNQVFIGMVTMQYQAQMDMVQLIEQLDGSCIRFVHFSKENELRSRVFSEKMGLESGWNCHISLLGERSRRDSGPSECWANNGTAHVSSMACLPKRATKTTGTPDKQQPINSSEHSPLDSSKALSYSAPSAINMEHAVVKFNNLEKEPDDYEEHEPLNRSQESLHGDAIGASHDWQSLSCLTDSTEQSVPINFDMSNRAKLPRGIDKIRPHIEHIDNVPLLVSLFTDCTASSTKEMIKIMQDYGEVICVIGSSANYETMGVFMQADASIAIEPLYPQMCQKSQICQPVSNGYPSPTDLSRSLNSVSCCLSIKRDDPLSIFYLITESRLYMNLVWNTVQFWLSSCVALSCLQMILILLFLPVVLTTGQIIWISFVIIPLLSLSLMGTPSDLEMIKKPQGKKQVGFNAEIFVYAIWCYGGKYSMMILSVVTMLIGTLLAQCIDICDLDECHPIGYLLLAQSINESSRASILKKYSQNFEPVLDLCLILCVIHLVVISASFVHRGHTLWQRSPHRNYLWLCISAFIIFLQVTFSAVTFSEILRPLDTDFAVDIEKYVLTFCFLSPILTLGINELIKREEIKTNLRYQRRARLDFGTKLGMNSPF